MNSNQVKEREEKEEKEICLPKSKESFVGHYEWIVNSFQVKLKYKQMIDLRFHFEDI